ncbi:hypothetical protein [Alkalisalibacterium limincola]|uniref:Outer membrane protein assembly factor BamC n=1 Tax=Alkalisalibacterium limincola TaxID=2699169 RepID=A0A5C8KQM5_9GAMM|nr:hypothetical protein [Alkalisalibacterium limincola]TXK62071.1 hypothetical protein FU658_09500 [Alkalisalibacterium limincola]
MTRSSHIVRRLLVAGLATSVVVTSGCGWFRASTGYEGSRETRPLEVPPDLTTPAVDPSMQMPTVADVQARRAPAGAQQAQAGAAVSSFEVADSAGEAWRRVGLALDRIDGVTITNRAQLLGSYEVQYRGESFLVRVQQGQGDTSTVTAVNAAGQAVGTGAATELLGLLRQRLG